MRRTALTLIALIGAGAALSGCSNGSQDSAEAPTFKAPPSAAGGAGSAGASSSAALSAQDSAAPSPSSGPAASVASTQPHEDAPMSSEVSRETREKIWNGAVPKLAYTKPGRFTNGVLTGEELIAGMGERASLMGVEDTVQTDAVTVDNFLAVRGNIDDDPDPEILVNVLSTGGGTGYSFEVVVYDENGNPQGVIQPLPDMKIQRGGLRPKAINGKDISFEWKGYRDTDPMATPSLNGSGTYTWDGSTLIPVDGPHFS